MRLAGAWNQLYQLVWAPALLWRPNPHPLLKHPWRGHGATRAHFNMLACSHPHPLPSALCPAPFLCRLKGNPSGKGPQSLIYTWYSINASLVVKIHKTVANTLEPDRSGYNILTSVLVAMGYQASSLPSCVSVFLSVK